MSQITRARAFNSTKLPTDFESAGGCIPTPDLDLASDRILSLAQVIATTGLSRSTLERLIREDDGPPRVRLSARRRGFPVTGLREWLARRERA